MSRRRRTDTQCRPADSVGTGFGLRGERASGLLFELAGRGTRSQGNDIDPDGLATAQRLTSGLPDTRILILSMHRDAVDPILPTILVADGTSRFAPCWVGS
jgi:hypothetical protein